MPLEKQVIRTIKTTFDVAFKDFVKYDQYTITEDRIAITFKNEERARSFVKILNAERSNEAGVTFFVPDVLGSNTIELNMVTLSSEQLAPWMALLTSVESMKTLVVRDVINNIQYSDQLSLLYRMAYGPEYEKIIREEGGIQALLLQLQLNSASLSVATQNSILFALRRMSQFNVQSQDVIREADGIPVLLELLKQRLEKKIESKELIDTLAALMHNNPINQKVIQATLEGVSVLMNLLKHRDPAIQQSAAMLLSEIAYTYQDIIREQEGIPLLLSLLEPDAVTPITQSWVAKTLAEMLMDNAENQRLILEKDGLDLLLSLLDSDKDKTVLIVRLLQNGGDQVMQQVALNMLHVLLNNDGTNGDLLADAGGIQQCLNLLQDENTPADLKPLIINILYRMDNLGDQKILQNADGVAILQEFVVNHNDNTSQESCQAVHILCQMACEPIFQETIRETEGVVELLLNVASVSDSAMQRLVINALHVMSVNLDNQLAIQEAGGISLFIKLLNSNDRTVQSLATATVAQMAGTFLNQKDLREAIAPLVTLLKKDNVDIKTKTAASEALIILACNPMNQDAFREAKGIELLRDLLSSHENDSEMQEWVAQALYVLTLGNDKNKNITFKNLAVPENKNSFIFGLLRSAQSLYDTAQQSMAYAAEKLKTVSNSNNSPQHNQTDGGSVTSTDIDFDFDFSQVDSREVNLERTTPDLYQYKNAAFERLSSMNPLPKNVPSTPLKATFMQSLQSTSTKSPVKMLRSPGVIAPEVVDVKELRSIILIAIKDCIGRFLSSKFLNALYNALSSDFNSVSTKKDTLGNLAETLHKFFSDDAYKDYNREKNALMEKLSNNDTFKRAFNIKAQEKNVETKFQSPQRSLNTNASMDEKEVISSINSPLKL